MSDEPSVRVTLKEIYDMVHATDDKLDNLATAVGDMVSINKRLDMHHERLNDHGSRLGVIETSQAVAAAQVRKPAPWYAVVGGIVAIVTGVATLVSVLVVLGQISAAVN